MRVRIKRQDGPDLPPYWAVFDYEKTEKETVAGILEHLNYRDDLTDITGKKCRRIQWECGCLQKMCGGCAMVIDHRPGLACNTFVDPSAAEELVLSPLTKFPVVIDLRVDRSRITEDLKDAQAYLGRSGKPDPQEFLTRYQAAKCLKCGLCLEVCPNYAGDGGRGRFYGAVAANEIYLEYVQTDDRKEPLRQAYRKHFENGCSKSLACMDICPVGISTLSTIGYMNRQGRPFRHKKEMPD